MLKLPLYYNISSIQKKILVYLEGILYFSKSFFKKMMDIMFTP